MRLKYLHHADEWLPGDYEAPKPFRGDYLAAWCIHPSARGDLLAIKLNGGGTGLWTSAGRLLHYIDKGADLVWYQESTELLSLENRFGERKPNRGVNHVLRRLESRSFSEIREMSVCVPGGFANYLVVNHGGDQCLITWRDDTEWGYVIVALNNMTQLREGLFYREYPTQSPPAYSLDDAFVVSCNPIQQGWWAGDVDNFTSSASAGGPNEVGIITVHDLRSDHITYHEVVVELPSGWLPDKPSRIEWSTIWGPSFVSDRRFIIWLPDDSTELLTLPLPPRVNLQRSLKTTREWLDSDDE